MVVTWAQIVAVNAWYQLYKKKSVQFKPDKEATNTADNTLYPQGRDEYVWMVNAKSSKFFQSPAKKIFYIYKNQRMYG